MQNLNIQNKTIAETTFCVLDFETTGTSAGTSRAIEIGIVKVKNLKIVDTFQTLLNPKITIPYFISKLTGITNGDVHDAPLFCEVADNVNNFIDGSIVAAHNLPFDLSFLKREFQIAGKDLTEFNSICTLKMSRKLFPHLASKSLGSVVSHLKIRHKNVHRALGDATVTAKILIKMINKLQEEFNVETLEELIQFQGIASTNETLKNVKEQLSKDVYAVPQSPGIYFFKNIDDKIIYIGKAKDLKKRVFNYFSNTAPTKVRKIVAVANRLGFEKVNSELTALLAEAELIKIHNPKFNTMLKKYGQTHFVRIDKNSFFPIPQVTANYDIDEADYFGPYNRRETATAILEIIHKTFLLRECKDKVLLKGKPCYLADIERCTAPCINNLSSETYCSELEKVYHFLEGKNQEAVNRLLIKMKKLSEDKKFEEAAQIRDTIQLLLNQLNRASILAEPVNSTNALIEIKGPDKKDYLLLIKGKPFLLEDVVTKESRFFEALDDYFNGSINLFEQLDERDLEKVKIALSWLVKNREKVKIFYLKDYNSLQELYINFHFSPRKNNSKIEAAKQTVD